MGAAAAVGLGLGALGAGLNYLSEEEQREAINARRTQLRETISPYLQQGEFGAADDLLNFVSGTEEFNTGQDGFMQMIRRGTGSFDNSQLFDTLGTLADEEQEEQVAGLRAGASGLGQRFGSAMFEQESELRADLENQQAARRAQIAQESFRGMSERALGAAGLLGDRLSSRRSIQLAGLQSLLGAQRARRAQQAQFLSLLAGVPARQAPSYGAGAVTNLGTLALLTQLTGSREPQQQWQPYVRGSESGML